jgi:hypothetical protein
MTPRRVQAQPVEADAAAGAFPALTALWWAGKDNWETAHMLVMDEVGKDCARVHAYLHRLEKDGENARYWYRRAGTPVATGSLKAEWLAIARDFLAAARQS